MVLIQRRRGLVEEQPVGLEEEGTGDREPLLLAWGEHVRPMCGLVQALSQGGQADRPEGRPRLGIPVADGRSREPQRLAQGPDRHVRPLRQEQRLHVRRQMDAPGRERPQPGQDAEQGAFAAA